MVPQPRHSDHGLFADRAGRHARGRRARGAGRQAWATPAQIALAWVMRQDGVIAIPKASRRGACARQSRRARHRADRRRSGRTRPAVPAAAPQAAAGDDLRPASRLPAWTGSLYTPNRYSETVVDAGDGAWRAGWRARWQSFRAARPAWAARHQDCSRRKAPRWRSSTAMARPPPRRQRRSRRPAGLRRISSPTFPMKGRSRRR